MCDCTAPWGEIVAHGDSVSAYASDYYDCGANISVQHRVCDDGVL